MRACVVKLTDEHDVDTLRQISLLLDRENQRLIAKNLAADRGARAPARRPGRRATDLHGAARAAAGAHPDLSARGGAAPAPRRVAAQPGHGPREQPALPIVEIRHELPPDQRQCPACGGDADRDGGPVRDVRAHHHGQAHVSGRASRSGRSIAVRATARSSPRPAPRS